MSYIKKSTNDMLATFPAPVQGITGEPTLHKLIRIIKHLMECSQKVETDISPLNYLFLVLESDLYATHTADMYPVVPVHAGCTPTYMDPSTVGERAILKQEWEYALMRHNNCLNMNAALKSRFLRLIDANIVDTYKSAAGILLAAALTAGLPSADGVAAGASLSVAAASVVAASVGIGVSTA